MKRIASPGPVRYAARSGKALIIAIIAVSVLAIGGIVYFTTGPKTPPVDSSAVQRTPEQEAAAQAQGEVNIGNEGPNAKKGYNGLSPDAPIPSDARGRPPQ